jgi:type VI secretion system protein ImpI
MTLTLAIENFDRLPDGGPVRFQARSRGLDIGRDAHLDWTLPDPDRVVSSKHCEIRFRDGGYWLTDVSTNGTYLNGSQQRLPAPTRLKDQDRLTIGRYIIAVTIEGDAAPQPPGPTAFVAPAGDGGVSVPADIWGGGESAPPENRAAFRPPAAARPQADFLDFAAPLQPVAPIAPAFAAPRPAFDPWGAPATAEPELAPEAPPPPTPSPRRPPPPPEPVAAQPVVAPAQPAPNPFAPSPFTPPSAPPAAPNPFTPPAFPPAAAFTPPPPPAPPPPARQQPDPFQIQASAPPPAPAAREPAPAVGAPTPATFDALARILAAAGVSASGVAGRPPEQLADDIGAFIGLVAKHLAEMLASRAETKSLIRSSSRTEIRALENNPLRFQATPAEALAIMLGPTHRSYLGAREALERSFGDLKEHQMLTFGAMQAALDALFEDLAPEKIERSVEPEKGLGGLLSSRKAKLWDLYVERWRSKTKRSDGRLNETFTILFGQAYDRLQDKRG